MEEIIRTPTESEKKDFIPIVDPSKRKLTVQEEFNERLGEEMQKAMKKRLPFCDRAARDDFKEGYDTQAQKSLRANGYVKAEEIKPVKIDWKKYSDLTNFDVIEEGETYDEFASKRNPGLDVYSSFIKYRYKGYSNTYTIMEDGPTAIRRARQKIKELEDLKKK